MRITNVSIRNYKSLRSVEMAPTDLSVIVGANASGKSNLADCFDFISEVYRHGLEVAVGRKGGYENIAFRKMRRSKLPVSINISLEFTAAEIRRPHPRKPETSSDNSIRIDHSFSFVARGSSIRAEFEVSAEELTVLEARADGQRLARVRRAGDRFEVELPEQVDSGDREAQASLFGERFLSFNDLRFFQQRRRTIPKTELIISLMGRFVFGTYAFSRAAEGIRVYQISPTKSREFGVPTPSPELERSGGNLPAVIDLLQKRNRAEWRVILQTMRSILPDLAAINVGYTSSRTLGLFFKEETSGRPWSVDEVSDGTVQTLALLVAIFDPSSTAIVVEEPENSVHPWIIRHLLDACREASRRKQIILTTHSPIVINAVPPEKVWVIWKKDGESHLAPLVDVDPSFVPMWQQGEIPTFDYLDSGAIAEALPPVTSEEPKE